MTRSSATTIDPAELPATIRDYLTAHTARDADTAIRAYTDDAVVTDDGHPYRGTGEILGWLRRSAAEYTFTTLLTGAQRVDDEHWVATNHLEGDFPGGVVDLHYRFTLRGDRISELTIGT